MYNYFPSSFKFIKMLANISTYYIVVTAIYSDEYRIVFLGSYLEVKIVGLLMIFLTLILIEACEVVLID